MYQSRLCFLIFYFNMEPFKTHTGLVAVLNRGNIDTDQIIPKDFLKSIKRTGYGEHLFDDWRYLANGQPNPEFELNAPKYKGASILVTGTNFGCGSSREHAVWAVVQAGYKVVIAPQKKSENGIIPGFADIFRNNCGKNGLLTIEMSQEEVDTIVAADLQANTLQATINLQDQKIVLSSGKEFFFEIDAGLKNHFLEGLDEIGSTLKYAEDISKFEASHNTQLPAA